jgi:hypothetical protein
MTVTALKVRLLLGHEHRLVADHRDYTAGEPAFLEDRDKLQGREGVSSEVFTTIAHPATSAGPSLHV